MTPLNTIQKLEKLFKDFPGIGPRQAKRFVYFLLTRNEEFTSEFVRLISELKHEATVCSSCFRYFSKSNPLSNQTLCSTCSDTERDATLLMIVSRDVDYENIERTSAYKGKYFILGGVVPILEQEPEKRIKITKLIERINNDSSTIQEIILALNANPEGENTADYIREKISDLASSHNIKISTLGRGLATGNELEYTDSETLRSAFKNRQ